MAKKQRHNTEYLAILTKLAEGLGVDLKDSSIGIATEDKPGIARAYNGSLEAAVILGGSPLIPGNHVNIDAPGCSGVHVELIDHRKEHASLSPEGAIYRIRSYMINKEGTRMLLSGDTNIIYVGRNGIIITNDQRAKFASESKGD